MKQRALQAEYYYLPDGQPDPIVKILNNCFERGLYFAARNELGDREDLYTYFLGSLTYELMMNDNGDIARLRPFAVPFENEVEIRKSFYIRGNGREVLAQMGELLDQGAFLLLRTAEKKLPFLKRYDPDFVVDDSYNPGHYLVVVGHDQDHIYYVENPDNLHPDRHRSAAFNPELGMVRKEDMLEPVHYFAECLSLITHNRLLLDSLREPHRIVQQAIAQSVRQHLEWKQPVQEGGYTIYKGRTTFEKLIALCEEETMAIVGNPPRLAVGLERIAKRRRLYNVYLNSAFNRYAGSSGPLLELFASSIKLFEIGKTIVLKKQRSGGRMDADLKRHFEKIMEYDDRVFEYLAGMRE